MDLNDKEQGFLSSRKKRIQFWPVVGSMLIGLLSGTAAWIWFQVPYLINPWAVMAAVKTEQVSESTSTIMVLILPVLVLFLFAVVFFMLLISFAVYATEKKYMAIIQKLKGD